MVSKAEKYGVDVGVEKKLLSVVPVDATTVRPATVLKKTEEEGEASQAL